MLESLTQLKSKKLKRLGTKSGYEVFVRGLKIQLLSELEEKSNSYLAQAINDYKLALVNPVEYLSFFKKSINSEAYRSVLNIIHGDIEFSMLTRVHSEMISCIKERIKKSKTIRELKHLTNYKVQEGALSSLELKVRILYMCPNAIRNDFDHIIEEFTQKNFTKLVDSRWEFDFFNVNYHDWISFIDRQSLLVKNQSKAFIYFWSIYKNFSVNCLEVFKRELLKPENQNEKMPSEVEFVDRFLDLKCSLHRPKLRVDCTERALVEFISSKWLTFTVRPQWLSIVHIDNVENFVKSNFLCNDSKHDLNQYPYRISIPVASDFTLFIRNLYEETFFSTKVQQNEESPDYGYRKIEIQLWLEYVFRNVDGFSFYNVETYFARNEIRERDFRLFSKIKELFQKSLEDFKKEFVTVKSSESQ